MRTLLTLLCSFFFYCSVGQSLNIMPYPQSVELKKGKFELDAGFTLSLEGATSERLEFGASRWLRRLDERTGLFFQQEFITLDPKINGALKITIQRKGEVILGEKESYRLSILPGSIKIYAETDLGALHGLETLIQLLQADHNGYFFPCLEIKDQPRFPWRGLMIDVARHFQPMEVIKRNLNAMAAVKMNVLHLHLSDDQGFRVESKVYPKLHEDASDGLYFTQVQIKEIIHYADRLGIRVYPEFDVPGHATAILTAYPALGSAPGPYQLQKNAGIFDPTLNPTIEETYIFLDRLFTEMAGLFPDEYFHIGGDENEGLHWSQNDSIQMFMKKHGFRDQHELQGYFTGRMLESLGAAGKKIVGWDEILHPGLPKEAVIHSWRGWEYMSKAAKEGYSTILSKGFYIDLMKPAAAHYLNDPLPPGHDLPSTETQYILGGEATMWSELVTPLTIDSRIWPRTAAIAERLWSPAQVNDVADMYARLGHVSLRLEEVGSMHIRNQAVIMRNLAAGQSTVALKNLLDVVEPMKGYTRNPGGTMYTMYSPYTLFADAATADAPAARKFNALVEKYLSRPGLTNREEIITYLELWKENHEKLLPVIHASPILKEVENLSYHLSMLAGHTLNILNSPSVNTLKQYEQTDELLRKAREQGGRTELQVVTSMERIIKSHTNKIEAPYIQGKIKIDGDLSEWQNSSWGYFMPGKSEPLKDTCFYALQWDEENLYLAFRMQNTEIAVENAGKTHTPIENMGLNLLIDRTAGMLGGQQKEDGTNPVESLGSTDTRGTPKNKKHGKALTQHFLVTRAKVVNDFDGHGSNPGKAYHMECTLKWTDLGKAPKRHELLGLHLQLDELGIYLDYPHYEGESPADQQLVTAISELVRLD